MDSILELQELCDHTANQIVFNEEAGRMKEFMDTLTEAKVSIEAKNDILERLSYVLTRRLMDFQERACRAETKISLFTSQSLARE